MSVGETATPVTHAAPADKRFHSDKPGSNLDSVFEETAISCPGSNGTQIYFSPMQQCGK